MARVAFLPDHGAKVEGPPSDWKRPEIPKKILAELLIRQNGKDPRTGMRLEPLTRGIEIDHDPPLKLRAWDPVKRDTIPPANSIEHLVVRDKPAHREKTVGGPVTSYGSDIHAIAKTKRLEERRDGETKPKRKWPTRKLPSRKDARKVPW
ncbi:hypothetical protein EN781_00370 [Mesorhizobium sp. M4A.F.Ca.ET.090.04.2.1]|uniref:hypothetical protein n=1 Tax=Mesorhizobium sp. M4A.F.Ca.ET.090.04.2.1 TaxID=2496663 RepID=UPI000FCB77F7|nr:hypothetical protein [Mesorhizobium sp. M4A.F.Ca.ET.090.04.2.1]RVC47624.1 hypothetical protein EN781_00370 [Mesorhizobium sp. M4A.F.Ca.ET.090.04.2.1]